VSISKVGKPNTPTLPLKKVLCLGKKSKHIKKSKKGQSGLKLKNFKDDTKNTKIFSQLKEKTL